MQTADAATTLVVNGGNFGKTTVVEATALSETVTDAKDNGFFDKTPPEPPVFGDATSDITTSKEGIARQLL